MAINKLEVYFSYPEILSVQLDFPHQMDPEYIRDMPEYILMLLQDLFNNGEEELVLILQKSHMRFLVGTKAYTKKQQLVSPYFNEIATEKNSIRNNGRTTPVISMNGKGTKSKWIDLTFTLSCEDENGHGKDIYEKIIESLKRIDAAKKQPAFKSAKKQPAFKLVGGSKRQIEDPEVFAKGNEALIASVDNLQISIATKSSGILDAQEAISGVTAPVTPVMTTDVSIAPTLVQENLNLPKIAEKKDEHEGKVVIPDELLNILLYSFKNNSSLEVVDKEKRLYFIPETAVDGILKDGTVYNMSKEFIAEATIRGNLPLAFVRRNGSFRTVIRVNTDQYNTKKQTYAVSTRDQMDMLIMGLHIHLVDGKNLQYIPHNLEDMRGAMEITGVAEESIRSFYGAVNMGSGAKDPTIRKGYLFTMPPDFNEELYETTRLQGFTDAQLIERLNTITSQLENLQSKNDQDEALLISYEQDIDAKQTNIQAKKDILSGTEYQLESLRTMAIDKLNAHQALPHTASVESIREFVTHQISLLQVMQNDLNAVSEASEEQAKLMKEIQIMEDEISVREKMITELLETRELDGVTHVTLAKEKTILMKDKDRRKEKLLSTLALFD